MFYLSQSFYRVFALVLALALILALILECETKIVYISFSTLITFLTYPLFYWLLDRHKTTNHCEN
ncbi:hypothetical protein C2G38_648510 [Gigaspora rosea]|uniref:Uncharacterized protein n=1 Tax=Gigaspora rosea TaxID=44941 RepID=A0A397W9I2_9GLOM|nr:hypothetical protein C2G38_648510 [Gigaspora rosea]